MPPVACDVDGINVINRMIDIRRVISGYCEPRGVEIFRQVQGTYHPDSGVKDGAVGQTDGADGILGSDRASNVRSGIKAPGNDPDSAGGIDARLRVGRTPGESHAFANINLRN